ncbi:hypothetical protein [Streptomyces sp. NPDC056061]|uniref:hypothetical protein n=1 Tax=Streptomyces sp. NPDC056061 TaxID=3345700 RepID=UPI0035D80264
MRHDDELPAARRAKRRLPAEREEDRSVSDESATAGTVRLRRAAPEDAELLTRLFPESRAFCERHGFTGIGFDDGERNEEGEPDVRHRWITDG